jgi:hypothetical protein
MMEWLTVLEVLGASLVVLFVLHLMSVIVNRSRVREQAAARSREKPLGKAKVGANTASVSAAAAFSPSPKIVIDTIPEPEIQSAAQPPKSSTIQNADRSKHVKRAKAAIKKIARSDKHRANGAHRPTPVFRPLSKAEPAILRRPKRTIEVRRRKQKPPVAFAKLAKPSPQDMAGLT